MAPHTPPWHRSLLAGEMRAVNVMSLMRWRVVTLGERIARSWLVYVYGWYYHCLSATGDGDIGWRAAFGHRVLVIITHWFAATISTSRQRALASGHHVIHACRLVRFTSPGTYADYYYTTISLTSSAVGIVTMIHTMLANVIDERLYWRLLPHYHWRRAVCHR